MPPDQHQLLTMINELTPVEPITVVSDETPLFNVLREVIAARFDESGCPPKTVGDLKKITHREVLMIRNCGWSTIREIHASMARVGVKWPSYDLPERGSFHGRPEARVRRAIGFVYLARTVTHRFTKIGFSYCPTERESTLQAEDPQFRIIFKVETTGTFEAWLHDRFAKKRIRGEWFDLTTEDSDYITSGAALKESGL